MNDQNINHAHGLIGALRRREALEIDCAREAREDGKHALADTCERRAREAREAREDLQVAADAAVFGL